ncbi:MAG: YqaE/Pmp3 family membrane protein [Lyngbya sp.]|nr:YqaE/Pmp3 family membrane protein [Lyngbya sp.]
MSLLRILLGIVLPPLGVFLTEGVSSALIINILLTIFGWLPGSIHAVWVITKHAERADERAY